MAARKKTPTRKAAPKRKKPTKRKALSAPKRKTVKRKAAAPRNAHRELPNDDAWRELVETAIEKPDPDVSAVATRRRSK